MATYAENIRKLAKEDQLKKGLSVRQERGSIGAMVTPPVVQDQADIRSPLTMEVLTTETVRVYQNNDDTSDNWVDVERALTAVFVDYNGKIFEITSFTWPVAE